MPTVRGKLETCHGELCFAFKTLHDSDALGLTNSATETKQGRTSTPALIWGCSIYPGCYFACRIQMLDAVRYMVVWNPLILMGMHGIFTILGLDHHDPSHAHAVTANAPLAVHSPPLAVSL